MTDPTNSDDNIQEGEDLVQPLSQDGTTPFSPPTDPVDDFSSDLDERTQAGRLDDTHQATDSTTDIDTQELYDEGLSGAVEAEEPNAGNAVIGYDPEKDRRKQQ